MWLKAWCLIVIYKYVTCVHLSHVEKEQILLVEYKTIHISSSKSKRIWERIVFWMKKKKKKQREYFGLSNNNALLAPLRLLKHLHVQSWSRGVPVVSLFQNCCQHHWHVKLHFFYLDKCKHIDSTSLKITSLL